jgi:hypothetical protein
MADYPSATPPPPPGSGPSARPGIVTAAAVMLIVVGGLQVLGGILVLAGAGVATGTGVGGLFAFVAIIILAIGAVHIYAGVKCLALEVLGRTLGMIIAVVGIVLQLLSIGRTPGTSIVGILIDAFIFYALYSSADHFHA